MVREPQYCTLCYNVLKIEHHYDQAAFHVARCGFLRAVLLTECDALSTAGRRYGLLERRKFLA